MIICIIQLFYIFHFRSGFKYEIIKNPLNENAGIFYALSPEVIEMNDILKKHTGEVVRLAMLSAHYKQPLNWNENLLIQANKNLENLYNVIGDEKILTM